MNLFLYAEALSRFLSSELLKWILMIGGVVLLLKWCNTPEREVYKPAYGQLTYDLLDTAIVRTARRNPDLTEIEIGLWANESTMRQIDSMIDARMKKWAIIRLNTNGKILIDE